MPFDSMPLWHSVATDFSIGCVLSDISPEIAKMSGFQRYLCQIFRHKSRKMTIKSAVRGDHIFFQNRNVES